MVNVKVVLADVIIAPHLASKEITYVTPEIKEKHMPAAKYKVRVDYSEHCYTVENRGVRKFDQARFNLSKELPAIIADLLNRRCSFANGMNYFTVDHANGEYEVYFDLFRLRETKSLVLLVHSAYLREPAKMDSRPKWKPIRFEVILYKIKNNQPIRR